MISGRDIGCTVAMSGIDASEQMHDIGTEDNTGLWMFTSGHHEGGRVRTHANAHSEAHSEAIKKPTPAPTLPISTQPHRLPPRTTSASTAGHANCNSTTTCGDAWR